MDVPYGSTIMASIDPASVPAGYVLEQAAAQTFAIPDGPPEGQYGGPGFVLLPAEPAGEPNLGSIDLLVDGAFCEPGYLGPFVGCTPWEGVTVSFESTDAPISTTCVTAASGGPTATCRLPVPYGSTIQVSIDPAVIPVGYALQQSPTQSITMPAGPPDGPYGGAAFVLLPAAVETPTTAPVTPVATEPPVVPTQLIRAFAAVCEPGYAHPFAGCEPWDDLTIRFVSDNGAVDASCVTRSDPEGQVSGCVVELAVGSSITASIDPAVVPEGRPLQGPETVRFVVPPEPVGGLVIGPMFVAQGTEGEPVIEPTDTNAG